MGAERDGATDCVRLDPFHRCSPMISPLHAIWESCKLWQPFVTLRTYLPKAKGYFVSVCSIQVFLMYCLPLLLRHFGPCSYADCTWICPCFGNAMIWSDYMEGTSRLLGFWSSLIRECLLHCLIGISETLEAVRQSWHPNKVQKIGISLKDGMQWFHHPWPHQMLLWQPRQRTLAPLGFNWGSSAGKELTLIFRKGYNCKEGLWQPPKTA
jgi:hypothetical protein